MSIIIQSTTGPTWFYSTPGSINKPASTVDGHLLVAFIGGCYSDAVDISLTNPSGWTTVGSDVVNTSYSKKLVLRIAYKIASSEPSSWSWTFGASLFRAFGVILDITGHDSSPIDQASSGDTGETGSGHYAITATGITVANNALVLPLYFMIAGYGNNPASSTPTNFSSLLQGADDATSTLGMSSFYATMAGATGDVVTDVTPHDNYTYTARIISINPAAVSNLNGIW